MRRDLTATMRAAGLAVLPMALMVGAVKVRWPTIPAEIYLIGVIQGLLVALIALGFVIVYRANRIVNFAAADLGGVPAAFALLLFVSLGWNIYLSAADRLRRARSCSASSSSSSSCAASSRHRG